MCGIGGIYRFENDSGGLAPAISPIQVDLLLNSLEWRGNDAAGVALVDLDGTIRVLKDNKSAWNFTSTDAYRKWMDENLDDSVVCALVHTRKATKGSPFKPENNHPLIKGAGVAVHNGVIHNDDQLFAQRHLERGAETDSDILRAILDEFDGVSKKTLKEMSQVAGTVASALVHPSDPRKLMLLRSGNPLVLGMDGDTLYFASDKRAIYRAARPWIKERGFTMYLQTPGLKFVTMPNDTGYIVGPKGLEWHDAFTSSAARFHRAQSYTDVYNPHAYESRQKRFAQEAATTTTATVDPPNLPVLAATPERQIVVPIRPVDEDTSYELVTYIHCPNNECGAMLLRKPEQTHPLSFYRCPKCHACLVNAQFCNKAIPVT